MNIGDKVRLLHGREEGVITRLLPGNQLEMEIEDGFRIPVMRSEVVVISPLEQVRFKKDETNAKSEGLFVPAARNPVLSEKGIYLSFVPVNDREATVYLVNNTDWSLPFTFQTTDGQQITGVKAGLLSAKTHDRVSVVFFQEFEKWPTFVVSLLFLREGKMPEMPPMVKAIRCRAQSFYSKKAKTPLLNRDGYVFHIDDTQQASVPAIPNKDLGQQIREKMLDKEVTSKTLSPAPAAVLDLHIEQLEREFKKLSNAQILNIQLTAFEDALERAISNGMNEITFIHGTGNGTLRDELHRRLGKHPNVRFFKDAQKEKFGYGATLVSIQ